MTVLWSHFIGRPGHAGTLDHGGVGGSRATVVCDCGTIFPAKRHPVESDRFESPQWEAHVKEMRD